MDGCHHRAALRTGSIYSPPKLACQSGIISLCLKAPTRRHSRHTEPPEGPKGCILQEHHSGMMTNVDRRETACRWLYMHAALSRIFGIV